MFFLQFAGQVLATTRRVTIGAETPPPVPERFRNRPSPRFVLRHFICGGDGGHSRENSFFNEQIGAQIAETRCVISVFFLGGEFLDETRHRDN